MGFFGNCFLGLHFDGRNDIRKAVTSKAMKIQVSNNDARFEACFSLHIDYLLYYFLKPNDFLILSFYFDLNRNLKVFLGIANYSRLIGDFNRIKHRQDKVKMLKIKCLILSFF